MVLVSVLLSTSQLNVSIDSMQEDPGPTIHRSYWLWRARALKHGVQQVDR